LNIRDIIVNGVPPGHASQDNIAHPAQRPLIHIVLAVQREARVAQANIVGSATEMVAAQTTVSIAEIAGHATQARIAECAMGAVAQQTPVLVAAIQEHVRQALTAGSVLAVVPKTHV